MGYLNSLASPISVSESIKIVIPKIKKNVGQARNLTIESAEKLKMQRKVTPSLASPG